MTATAAHTRSSPRPLAFPRAPLHAKRRSDGRISHAAKSQRRVAQEARVRMSWLLVPLLGAAAHAAPCPGLCYLAVHALGVPRFAAVVALLRRCGAAPHETAFYGTNYLPAAVQERHFGMVQVRVSHSAHSAADRELIGHVEDALSAGPPTIAPPAPSSAVPSVNATFTLRADRSRLRKSAEVTLPSGTKAPLTPTSTQLPESPPRSLLTTPSLAHRRRSCQIENLQLSS
jgi:hypothetical protein